MGKKHFCFFQTAETGNRTPNSGVKGSDANYYPRAPAFPANNISVNSRWLRLEFKVSVVTPCLKIVSLMCSDVIEISVVMGDIG